MSRCRIHCAITMTALIACAIVRTSAAQPPRRDGQRVTAGTAVVTGIVVSDNDDPRPLRRARVMINNAERTVGRTVITDDTGTFAFDNLPQGRYTLSATKDALVTVIYGQRRLGRPGTPIVLAEGQRVADITLRIPRGAVITGTILDENGQPLPGASVRVGRAVVQSGARTFVPAGSPQVTDDRGAYRIYGLMPGEYLVAASAPLGQGSVLPEIRAITATDVRRAMNETRRPSSTAQPGLAPQSSTSAATPPTTDSATVAYAPIYFPGVTFANQATRLALGAGEERGGVDFQMQLVPTAKIEGTVIAPVGVSGQVTVNMLAATDTMISSLSTHFRTTRTDLQGRFVFNGVMPGQYTILTRGGSTGTSRAPQPGRVAPTLPLWAQAEIAVDGRDISDITLALQAGLTIAGGIQFEGSRTPPADLTRIRVSLLTVQSPGEITLGVSAAQVEPTGRFRISGIAPAHYRIGATIPVSAPAEAWFLKSAVVNGRDVLDVPLDLRSAAPNGDIVITFTDRSSELSGVVQDASGQPVPEHQIIAFTTDQALWMPQARRIQSVRPSADGRYTIRNLPPGEYFLAAVSDVEPGEWYDPGFLQHLAGTAIKVTLAEFEQKRQDLTLAGSR